MSDTASQSRQQVPPYVPYKTFLNFLDTLKSVGMPSHIDKAAMGSMSGGNQSWLKAAMRYMKLIDADGAPQASLRALVDSEGAARKSFLQDLFKRTYRELLQKVDLQNTTPSKLRQAFIELGGQGETVEKNVAFLVAFAKDADVPLSPYITKRAAPTRRAKPNRVAKVRNDGAAYDDDEGGGESDVRLVSPEQMLLDMLDPNAMEDGEKQAVWTLLLYLKKQGK
jgi:uncharacterized protein DUF5343